MVEPIVDAGPSYSKTFSPAVSVVSTKALIPAFNPAEMAGSIAWYPSVSLNAGGNIVGDFVTIVARRSKVILGSNPLAERVPMDVIVNVIFGTRSASIPRKGTFADVAKACVAEKIGNADNTDIFPRDRIMMLKLG